MLLSNWDYLIILFFFGLFIHFVYKSYRSGSSYPEYFNAGGNLHWVVIGFSILGTNIGLDNIQSSAANGFTDGLAFGSYEWTASFVIILAALYIIPFFMRVGVFTLPEYLGHRYNENVRTIMAIIFIFLHMGMLIVMLISCSVFIQNLLGVNKLITIMIAAVSGGVVLIAGGMRSKIRLDIMVVSIFFIVSGTLLILCLTKVGSIEDFASNAAGRLRVVLPSTHEQIPWNSVFLGGLWVLHLNFWCFFQPIGQTALISKSLSQTQKGLLLVASAKLLIPFLVLVPGIVGFELFSDKITDVSLTLPIVIQNVVPVGFAGIFILGYACTIMAIYNGYLTATANVFTLDIYRRFKNNVSDEELVKAAKMTAIVFVFVSILAGYFIDPDGTLLEYNYIFLACVAPITTSVFIFAIFSRRTPSIAAIVSMLAGVPVFFILKATLDISRIDLSGATFVVLAVIMGLIRIIFPRSTPVVMPEKIKVKFERNLAVVIWSIFILTAVLAIYLILG